MPELDFDPAYIDKVAVKFATLGEIFTHLGKPEAVTELLRVFLDNDAGRFQKLIEGWGADRIPVIHPDTACRIVADFTKMTFDFGPGAVPVVVLREPLTQRQVFQVWSCQAGTNGSTRTGRVQVRGGLGAKQRTIVEGEGFIQCLQSKGLVENGEELVDQTIEVLVPNGEKLRLCPFPEFPRDPFPRGPIDLP